MKITEILQVSKIFYAIMRSKYKRNNTINHWQFKSGRYPYLPRFTKLQNHLLESLYSISDIRNPSAYRIYLYLVRMITGYKSRSSIEYNPKKIKIHINMGNSFYNGIKCLEDKNMIHYEIIKGIKHIGLNPHPDTWVTDSLDRINEIIDEEVDFILERKNKLNNSSSSSSWSSSSSSSNSYPYDDEDLDKALLEELDRM
jgi:hypothetical protein